MVQSFIAVLHSQEFRSVAVLPTLLGLKRAISATNQTFPMSVFTVSNIHFIFKVHGGHMRISIKTGTL
jgi:hypothetical protein